MVKASPSNAGGAGSIPGQGEKIPHASWPQNVKQKQHIVTNSIKTLKTVKIKKSFLFFFSKKIMLQIGDGGFTKLDIQ